MIKIIIKIYHKILNLFFEFDVGVYALKTSKVPVKRFYDIKYNEPVVCHKPKVQNIKDNNLDLSAQSVNTYLSKPLNSSLILRNCNWEFYNAIKIKEESLNYICISKNYNINFKPNSHKSLKDEIEISKTLRTIEEILEMEPYTNEYSTEKLLKYPIIKKSVKKDKFNKAQLDYLRTKLASEAKCKKYSITVDNIFDNIPEGLYSEIELTKDNNIKCFFNKNPQLGELQLLVTGMRKYDTQVTKVLVKYSEIGF